MRTESILTATAPVAAANKKVLVPRAVRRGLTSVVVLLAVWYLSVDLLGLVPERVLPSLGQTLNTLGTLITTPFAGHTLAGHAADSLIRWVLGVLLAVVVGVPLGLLMGWYRILDAVVSPLFNALRSIPPLAWIPLAILWMGTGLQTEVTLVFVAAFPPIVLNAYQAARYVETPIVWGAQSVGASSLRQLVQVVVPTELPLLISGLRIAFGNGLMAVVAAELVSAKSGLGFMIVRGQQDFQPAIIFVGMMTIAVIGLTADILLNWITRPLLRWRNTHDTE